MKMKLFLIATCTSFFLFATFSISSAQTKVLPKVRSDPQAACNRPDTADITFALPKKIKPNFTYKAAPFYAVILEVDTKGLADCGANGEYFNKTKRRRAQALFPARKVFADNQCPDLAGFSYDVQGLKPATVFMAVYAGETMAEAQEVLALAKTKYPNAVIKRVQVSYEEIVQ